MQTADVDSSKRKLIKACRTRRLSHADTVIAMKVELSAVHATLNCFVSTKDCTADGVLYLIFLFSFWLLHAALEHPNEMSLLFQKGSFHFPQVQSALLLCQKEAKNIADADHVINSLKLEWEKISKFLPSLHNDYLSNGFKLIRFTAKT